MEYLQVLRRGFAQFRGHGGVIGLIQTFFRTTGRISGCPGALADLGVSGPGPTPSPEKQLRGSPHRGEGRAAERACALGRSEYLVTLARHSCPGLRSPPDDGTWGAVGSVRARPDLPTGRGKAAGGPEWTGDGERILRRANDIKVGKLVGEDKYGNKYYEDNKQFFGRHRWVMYTTEMNGKNTFWDVDGSMVPPEWHRWLHCMTDDPPTTKPLIDRKFIWKTHQFNVSGTPQEYVPYSTTKKKIHEWVPPSTPYK